MSEMINQRSAKAMFKRLWESLNDWAEALGMDDPRGEYTFRQEDRVAKLEREVESLQIQSRTTAAGSLDNRAHRLQS
jgi:hypothetical protein